MRAGLNVGNFDLLVKRIRTLFIILLVIFMLFAARLVQIQGIESAEYTRKAVNEMEKTRVIPAPRGDITDINGVAFARSVSAINIVVDQKLIKDHARVAAFVAPILGLTEDEVITAITGVKRYSMVLESAEPSTWNRLSLAIDKYNSTLSNKEYDKRIAGFFPERNYIREYPSGNLVSSLVGFVRKDGLGASGIELSMNSSITGIPGAYSYARGRGAEIPGSQSEIVAAQAGTTVRLTIDRDIQWVASHAIAEAVKKARASSGTVIVMDPRTGAVLAHATAPTFNPNDTRKVSLDLMRNPSVQDVYEPGSTGKIVTLAAALEEGRISPETVFDVPYKIRRGGEDFKDHERHPLKKLTTAGILAESSNTGTIKIAETMSNDTLHSYLTKFGIGLKTGVGLPGENVGKLLAVKDWSGTTAPTVAFGQGYSLNAMQATSIFATIANGGIRVSPTVIAGTSDASGNFTQFKNEKGVQVVSASTAAKMRLMMESVVSSHGTAPSAAIPGYRVAGKTGTAWRWNEDCDCYSGYTASFIGFAPADVPAFVINVTIQDPKGGHYGGALGGPVFKKVMTFVLQSRHIGPTGTTFLPVALNKAELEKKAREDKKPQKVKIAQASSRG
jgi:cell division protein FtsI (penicillin-binding protein 3)